jgi:PD-(D/E)XK endonuclease
VPYHGQIDVFGVYCLQNGQVYFVPIADLEGLNSEVSLRLLPTKSGQEIGIRYAPPYSYSPMGRRAV